MKKVTLLFFWLLSLNIHSQTGVNVPGLANFDVAMLNLLNQYQIPGGQLAITYQGRLVYNRGFGLADTTLQVLVQPDHIFRIASISKSITAVTIMHLVERGQLHLEDKIFGPAGILDDSIYQNILDPIVLSITVRNILNHNAGWKSNQDPSGAGRAYSIAIAMGVPPPAPPEAFISWSLSNRMLDYIPGTTFAYSNFGYCVLGEVIEKVSGQSYEDYVRDSILRPLNICDMQIGKNLKDDILPDEVTYYDYPGAALVSSIYDNTTLVPFQYGRTNIEQIKSAGGWVASAEDLCKLLVSIDHFNSKPDFLLPATIDTMIMPASTSPNYAKGWVVSGNDYWHTGGLNGSGSQFYRNGNFQVNWAIVLNSLPQNNAPLYADMNNLVNNALPGISVWPSHDLFNNIPCIPIDIPFAPIVGTITQPSCSESTGAVELTGLPEGTWKIEPGTISGSTASIIITGLNPGTINFTVTNAAGISSIASDTVIIQLQPLTPATPIIGTITQPIGSLNTGSVELSGLPEVFWIIEPGAITGSTASVTISGLSPGTYNFTVSNAVGCISSASDTVTIDSLISSIKSISTFERNINIYPNPTNGRFQLRFTIDKTESIRICLLDIQGQVLFTEMKNPHNELYETTLDLSKQSKGIYSIQITADSQTVYRKIVVN